MKLFSTIALFFVLALPLMAQQKLVQDTTRRTIEVTGTAEKEIVPDEIFINITLRERMDNKDKITIEQQEKDLKAALTQLGLNLNDLALADANADYIKVRRKEKGVITSSAYTLKVKDAAMVGKVFDKLDDLKIFDSYIKRVYHSKMEELKREVKINAIKAARDKANYLVEALGEKTGRPIRIVEQNFNVYDGMVNYRATMPNRLETDLEESEPALQFQKIKLQESVHVIFEIK